MNPIAHAPGNGADAPATSELIGVLNQAIARVRAHFGAVTAQLEVTPAQAKAIAALSRPSTLSDLSLQLGSDVSNTANVVKALEAHGLLTRQQSEEDRRVRTLTLTGRGERVREQLQRRAYENSPVFDGLSAEQRRLLYDLLLLIVAEPLDGEAG